MWFGHLQRKVLECGKKELTRAHRAVRTFQLQRTEHSNCSGRKCVHAKYGEFLWSLLEDPSWVARRTETVRIHETGGFERSVTLDISLINLRDRLDFYELPSYETIPIPFALLRKGLLLDVDLRGTDGQPLSVATSFEDSFAAQLVCEFLDPTSVQCGHSGQAYFDVALSEDSPGSLVSQSGVATPEFFHENFMMMTSIDISISDRYILKYRLVETPTLSLGRRWAERLGWTPQFILIEAPSVGYAEREHLRVVAPAGTFIDSSQLYRSVETPEDERELGFRYRERTTPARAAVYTREAPLGRYDLGITLRVHITGSLLATLLFSFIALLMALGVSLGELLTGFLSYPFNEAGSDSSKFGSATLPITIAILSITAGFIFRQDGSSTSTSHLAVVRFGAIVGAFTMFLGVVLLTLTNDRTWIMWSWGAVAAINLFVFLNTLWIAFASQKALKRITRAAEISRWAYVYDVYYPLR